MATKKTTTKKAVAHKTAKKASAGRAAKSTRTKKAAPKKTPAKKAAPAKAKPAADTGKKLSALDAATKVLASAKEPMSTRQMVEAMGGKKLWTSPGGKTPHATLYAAILREILKKGADARFTKTERRKFAANG